MVSQRWASRVRGPEDHTEGSKGWEFPDLVLPKEVVSRLRTGEGEQVYLLEGPNNTYRPTPLNPAFANKMEKAAEIMGSLLQYPAYPIQMSDPIWIDAQRVLAIHERQLAEHGGGEGGRDESLLESAPVRPLNHHTYSTGDIVELAAKYTAGTPDEGRFCELLRAHSEPE